MGKKMKQKHNHVWFLAFFKLSSFVFIRKTFIQVWVNYPFK